MKLNLIFKNPETLPEVLKDLNEEEYAKVKNAISKFIKWGEYVEIEIDTETMTAKIVEVSA
jgi:hypothetical protein